MRARSAASALPGVLKSPRRSNWNGTALCRRFHFSIEISDDVLECRDRLLNRGNLHQLPAADRAVAILQGDNQIPPLLFELNKRQTVVRQMSHHGHFQPLD